jgi:AcrR family transcriptional regulator
MTYSEDMPRETLTREQIVNGAIELLDAEGLEGLNMRALGKRLGSAATAVYWHVGSKSNLIALAGDWVWGEVALSDLAATDWRTAAEEMAIGLHAMLTHHPWLVQAFGTYMVYGPGKARCDDHSLAVFEAAGFSSTQADQAATMLFTFVLGNALGPAAADSFARKLRRDVGNAEELVRDQMMRAREIAAEFPHLGARIGTSAIEYAAAPEKSFEFGLQAILDGLEAKLVSPADKSEGGCA